jgi:hypothetical protein
VRDAYRRLHDAVSSGRRTLTVFEYRCDSPIAERHMRMSISAVTDREGVAAVLYQSQMLAAVPRPPLRLFAQELRAPRADPDTARPDVLLCAFCHRVAWPLDADRARRRWIDATEYYRRGGPSDVVVTDSICHACARHVVTPNV